MAVINNATIQMRRGNLVEFDPSKLKAGEWAVALDEKYVYMCFGSGIVKQMATKDAQDILIEELRKTLAECKTIEAGIKAIEKLCQQYATESTNSSYLSKSYAVGQTGKRTGEDTDNAKYYSQQAKTSATESKTSETNAKTSEDNAKTSETKAKTSEDNAKTSETNAKTSETNALNSEDNAKISEVNAKTSEDNAKLSEINAKASEDNAKLSEINAKTSEDVAKETLSEIKKEISLPEFIVDFTTGHLLVSDSKYTFNINQSTGHLEWGVTA